MDYAIRRAAPSEADSLKALARASKAYWGYPQSYMREWSYDARITEGFISNHDVFCAEVGASITGFYALSPEDHASRIEHFWVAPAFIGRGVGKALFEHAVARACSIGASVLVVTAEPKSAAFYERMGARRVGEVHAPTLEQSFPELEYPLDGRAG